MKYDPMKPVTVSNCPTREALERPATLTQSIRARHSRAKVERHQENVRNRAMRQASGGRKQVVKTK